MNFWVYKFRKNSDLLIIKQCKLQICRKNRQRSQITVPLNQVKTDEKDITAPSCLLRRIYSGHICTKYTVGAARCRCIRPSSWHLDDTVTIGDRCNCSAVGNKVKLEGNITRRCGRGLASVMTQQINSLCVPLKQSALCISNVHPEWEVQNQQWVYYTYIHKLN